MKKIILITLAFLPLLLSSCSKDDEGTPSNLPFKGTWSGVYIGGDNGMWTANIDAAGNITGEISSYLRAMTLPLEGSVNSQGTFEATVGTSADNIFKGQIKDNMASGTWENTSGDTGTWEGIKQ